jgi:hypothetical protein
MVKFLSKFTGGKLIFENIDQEVNLLKLWQEYADGFEGTFTLNATGLHYELNGVDVSAKSVETSS